jgi:hypothetical protein
MDKPHYSNVAPAAHSESASVLVKKSDLYHALRTEIHRHGFSTLVDEPPAVAQGGRGVVVPGCPTCKKRISTMPQIPRSSDRRCSACVAG